MPTPNTQDDKPARKAGIAGDVVSDHDRRVREHAEMLYQSAGAPKDQSPADFMAKAEHAVNPPQGSQVRNDPVQDQQDQNPDQSRGQGVPAAAKGQNPGPA